MKQIILGTAGHIDHGKTSLIRSLTGVDTDRLKEEKIRGITIELGFASLVLPSGQHLGIVDVPGHEKFVKNMVAGATGIDIVAMVIAADEGVMPQTREHMEICNLLGIDHGVVVLTKKDLVDEEWLELVKDDVDTFIQGTFLENAPIIPVSSQTGEGLPELLEEIGNLCTKVPGRSSSGLFRLPVDRVFSMKGFGTVITGTLISGKICVGEPVAIYPSGVTSKVRGLQVHNASVEEAFAGNRTAINFQGLSKEDVNRGDVVAAPNTLKPSFMVDVTFHYLGSNPKKIKNRTRIRFHTGTSEILGHLILLDREELEPNEAVIAQIRLEAPVTIIKNDRFVIRSYSPVRTIGGGKVLNPIPNKHKRFRQTTMDQLQSLTKEDPREAVNGIISLSETKGVLFHDLLLMTSFSNKELEKCLNELLSSKTIILIDKENRLFMHETVFESLRQETFQILEKYHHQNPLKVGISKEELKSKMAGTTGIKLFTLLLNSLQKSDTIAIEDDLVRLTSHKIALKADQEEIKKKIIDVYKSSGITPPYFKDVVKTMDADEKQVKEVMRMLVEQGQVVKIKEDLYYDPTTIDIIKGKIVDFFKANPEMTTPQFKDMLGASRKYIIPLLEFFDSKNVTIRVGDIRKLRKV